MNYNVILQKKNSVHLDARQNFNLWENQPYSHSVKERWLSEYCQNTVHSVIQMIKSIPLFFTSVFMCSPDATKHPGHRQIW